MITFLCAIVCLTVTAMYLTHSHKFSHSLLGKEFLKTLKKICVFYCSSIHFIK